MIKNENFVIIQGWMINELQLKGCELLLFALIWGFSQTENQYFTGSLTYLAEWTQCTKQGVLIALNKLIEKKYIEKKEEFKNNLKYCSYKVSLMVLNKVERGIKESLTPPIKESLTGIKESLTNNIDNSIVLDKIEHTNNMSVSENLEPIKPIDPYTSDLIEKVFDIYSKECNNLCPLGGYARKNRSLREAISGYMWQTNNDIDYFTSICKKANELKIIADKKIDLKMILNCYEGIDNGKYIKTEKEEWSVNDLFKKEEK